MKNILVTLVAISFSLGVLAKTETYTCDILKDSKGSHIYGGPAYAVEIGKKGVVLRVSHGGDIPGPRATHEFVMKKVSQQIEAATYEVLGITANVELVPVNGKWETSVSISKNIAGTEVSAHCE